MERRWAKRASAVALAFGAALAGMGFDLGNAAWAATVPSVVAVAVHPVVLSGIAVQGPMVASAVTLYLVNPTNGASLAAIRTVPTDGLGNFTIGIQAQPYPMRLVARGGSFRSEMDGSTIANQSSVSLLLAAKTTSLSGISINPMTTFIDALARARLNAGGTTLTAALSSATAKIESYYGLSTDPGTLAPDYRAVGVGTDGGKLGLILGALINEDQHLCPGKPGGLIAALKADISDGHFDGRKAGVAVSYCGGKLPAIAGTSYFQDALSGVQQLQDVTAAFAFGGLYGPAGNVLMNQVSPVTPDLLLVPLATINAAITHAAPSPPNTPSPAMTAAHAVPRLPRCFPTARCLSRAALTAAPPP